MQKRQSIVLVLTLLLNLLGLLFVFESSVAESYSIFGTQYHFLTQHIIGLALGLSVMSIGLLLPPQLWIKISPMMYVFGLLLLVLVLIPGIGSLLNGARRWIIIGGIVLQPIEVFKFSLISFYSYWLSKHQRLIPFLFLTAIPSILVLLQPDLGSLLVVGSIACALYFVAGGEIKKMLLLSTIIVPVLIISIIAKPYRLQRVTTFLNPEADPLGASFHIRQITLALGRGGLTGQGIGGSNQKFSYIPEASTDSIFAIIAEEIGFIGCMTIILLFCLFFYHSYMLVLESEQSQAVKLLGFGIILWIALQVVLNLSAVVALVPLTGVPLPFFSYGRSSLVMLLFVTGILIRIGKKT